MSALQLQAIEASLAADKALVEQGNALERLIGNRDFKSTVLQGYFKDEAVRLVHLLSDPEMQTPDRQESVISDMRCIAGFSQYLNIVKQRAAIARKNIPAAELAIEELNQEVDQ